MSLADSNSTDPRKISKHGGARPNSGGRRPGAGRPKGSISDERKAEIAADSRLKDLAREHTAAAVSTLVAMMNDVAAPPAARVAAVKEILDRGHGKSTQVHAGDPDHPIEHYIVRDRAPSADEWAAEFGAEPKAN